jgi:eukaryotic-like serine/threonine-protein kinase
VWRATDLVLARPVAVKLLRPEVAADADALARFRAEARHAGSLVHAGVARVFDYDEPAPGCPPFLVMEYVDGPSLAGLLDGGPLPPGQVLDIVAQASQALAAAHEAGLVHRDIKPQNILLSSDGLVKLTDFGISLAAGMAPLTSTGTVLGTSGYLAPERLEGARGTPAGDVYALGVVAYEALAGRPPFTGTPAEIAQAHHDRAWPPLPAGVPAEVIALIGRMTARDPVLRPGAAAAGRRAGELRDQLSPPVLTEPAEPLEAAAPARPAGPAEPADTPAPGWPGTAPQDWPQPARPAPAGTFRLTFGLAAATVLALVGWALVSLLGSHAHDPSAAAPSRGRMVEIDAARLRGQAVPAVRRELVRLGLLVRVRWRPDEQARPGTVLAVQPAGRVPARSVVVVTGARRPGAGPAPSSPVVLHHHRLPPGHRHPKGHGKGHRHKKGHGPGQSPTPAPSPTPSPTPTSTSPSPTPTTTSPTGTPTSTPAVTPGA